MRHIYIALLIITPAHTFCAENNNRELLRKALLNHNDTQAVSLIAQDLTLIDAPLYAGTSPLHLSARSNTGMTDFLIRAGASVNALTHDHETPLHVAAFSCCSSTAHMLIDAGAHVNQRNLQQKTPLLLAVVMNQYGNTIIETLLTRGASLEDRFPSKELKDGYTCLYVAVANKNRAAAQTLIEYGALIDVQLLPIIKTNMPDLVPLACAHNHRNMRFLQQHSTPLEYAAIKEEVHALQQSRLAAIRQQHNAHTTQHLIERKKQNIRHHPYT